MLHYSSELLGTFYVVQNDVKFKIQIRRGNCLAVFLYVTKLENPEDPKKPWLHQLCGFFVDEHHVKSLAKDSKKGCMFRDIFYGDIKNVKLNLAYKESNTLLKYFIRDGIEVKCFYEKPKTK